MNPATSFQNRLLWPVTFVISLAGMWALRWGFSAGDPPAARRSVSVPQLRGSSVAGRGAQAADVPLTKPAGLLSVESGLVVWPANGDPAAVAEAFAAAWRKLEPSLKPAPGAPPPRHADEDKARQLFADWWKVDADGAVRFVSDPPGLFAARGGMFLLPLLTARDPQRAWTVVEASADMLWLNAARREVLGNWAQKSSDEVMAFAATLPTQARRAAEDAALRAWPVEQALEWCAALPAGWHRSQHERVLVQNLMQNDPAKAAAMLRAGTLPGASAASLFQAPGGYGRPEDAARFARAAIASDSDPIGFCLWTAQSKSGFLEIAAWTALLENQAAVSGSYIASVAAKMPENSRIWLAQAAGHTAPQEGLAWAAKDEKTLNYFFRGWAEHDPAGALAAAASLPQAESARLTIAAESVQSAPEVAIAALRDYPDKTQAAPLLRDAARRAAHRDPALALEALALAESTTAADVSAVLAIGGRSDPQATAAALTENDLPISDYVAVESFTRGWATADPEASSRWVRSLPPGELRDGGAAGLARTTGEADPVGGYLWALEISDEALRNRVLRSQNARTIKSGQAAETFLADPRLNETQRQTLRTRIHGPPTP